MRGIRRKLTYTFGLYDAIDEGTSETGAVEFNHEFGLQEGT